jgi:hypothetical protein
MSEFLSFVKARPPPRFPSSLTANQLLLLPLTISALLYALAFHLLLPLYRRHRARYAQYLPLVGGGGSGNDSGEGAATRLRRRVTSALLDFLPTFRFAEPWLAPARGGSSRRDRRRRGRVVDAGEDDDDDENVDEDVDAGDEELEDAVWDGGVVDRRVAPTALPLDRHRRLSRELEEGFMDSSSDEGGDGR